MRQASAVPRPGNTQKRSFSSVRSIAVVGASGNDVRPSWFVVKYLVGKGFRVFPVNPGLAGGEIVGRRVHARLADIGEPIDMVDIFRGRDAVPEVVEEALQLSPPPRVIWMQLGVRNDEAARRAEQAGLKGFAAHTAEGEPAEQIVETAKAQGVDQIVMATHARSATGAWVLGSVAQRVVHLAPMPVTLVK